MHTSIVTGIMHMFIVSGYMHTPPPQKKHYQSIV